MLEEQSVLRADAIILFNRLKGFYCQNEDAEKNVGDSQVQNVNSRFDAGQHFSFEYEPDLEYVKDNHEGSSSWTDNHKQKIFKIHLSEIMVIFWNDQ